MTQGVFEVSGVHHSSMDTEKLLEYAALAECHSSHPISKSLKKGYGKPLDPGRVTDVEEISGNGVTAKGGWREGCCRQQQADGKTRCGLYGMSQRRNQVHMAVDGKYAGHILISDQIKASCKGSHRGIEKMRREKDDHVDRRPP